jgi:hypothetical protein
VCWDWDNDGTGIVIRDPGQLCAAGAASQELRPRKLPRVLEKPLSLFLANEWRVFDQVLHQRAAWNAVEHQNSEGAQGKGRAWVVRSIAFVAAGMRGASCYSALAS